MNDMKKELELTELSLENLQKIREWRNVDIRAYRTPYFITEGMQEDFYRDVICNRRSNHRYWALVDPMRKNPYPILFRPFLIGMGGIINIQWENRLGEISLFIHHTEQRQGYGKQAVELLLDQAFNYMNLENVYGECYYCAPSFGFWRKICIERKAGMTMLPCRKYWAGNYHDSMYFNFNKGKLS